MSENKGAVNPADAGPVHCPVGQSPGALEAEVLRNLADHARFEAEVMGACDGSMQAQKAACLEWLACGAEYQQFIRGCGPRVRAGDLLAAEQSVVKQFKHLLPNAL